MLKLGIPHTWGLGSKLASRLEDIGMTPNLAFFGNIWSKWRMNFKWTMQVPCYMVLLCILTLFEFWWLRLLEAKKIFGGQRPMTSAISKISGRRFHSSNLSPFGPQTLEKMEFEISNWKYSWSVSVWRLKLGLVGKALDMSNLPLEVWR